MPDWLTLAVDQTPILDIPGGWVTVLVALITVVIGPTVSIILGARTNRRVKATQEQVTNSHPTNMRVEQDERHNALMTHLGGIQATLRAHGRDIGGIREEQRLQRREMGQIREELAETRANGADDRERINDLERTKPPRPRRPQNKKE